jgi:hypothetical protein
MSSKVLDEILATDKRIRYVGILSSDLRTVASKTRGNAKLIFTKGYVDDVLVKLAAPTILGALSRFADKCGKLVCSGVRFEKLTLIFFKIGDMHIAVSTEPGPPYIIMQKLEQKFRL